MNTEEYLINSKESLTKGSIIEDEIARKLGINLPILKDAELEIKKINTKLAEVINLNEHRVAKQSEINQINLEVKNIIRYLEACNDLFKQHKGDFIGLEKLVQIIRKEFEVIMNDLKELETVIKRDEHITKEPATEVKNQYLNKLKLIMDKLEKQTKAIVNKVQQTEQKELAEVRKSLETTATERKTLQACNNQIQTFIHNHINSITNQELRQTMKNNIDGFNTFFNEGFSAIEKGTHQIAQEEKLFMNIAGEILNEIKQILQKAESSLQNSNVQSLEDVKKHIEELNKKISGYFESSFRNRENNFNRQRNMYYLGDELKKAIEALNHAIELIEGMIEHFKHFIK